MTDQPEKLDLTSYNISEEKKQELLCLFPEIRTEGGEIDFDKLKLVLAGESDAAPFGAIWTAKSGEHRLRVVATDRVGKSAEATIDFTVK